jgi:hypothetical protein
MTCFGGDGRPRPASATHAERAITMGTLAWIDNRPTQIEQVGAVDS